MATVTGKKTESVPFKTTLLQRRAVDVMVTAGIYATRGEAIRDGIRMLMERHHIEIADCGPVAADAPA